jgi:hypothetical protein
MTGTEERKLKEELGRLIRIYEGEIKDIHNEEQRTERVFIREEYARNRLIGRIVALRPCE